MTYFRFPTVGIVNSSFNWGEGAMEGGCVELVDCIKFHRKLVKSLVLQHKVFKVHQSSFSVFLVLVIGQPRKKKFILNTTPHVYRDYQNHKIKYSQRKSCFPTNHLVYSFTWNEWNEKATVQMFLLNRNGVALLGVGLALERPFVAWGEQHLMYANRKYSAGLQEHSRKKKETASLKYM